jgi:hypothetical protein
MAGLCKKEMPRFAPKTWFSANLFGFGDGQRTVGQARALLEGLETSFCRVAVEGDKGSSAHVKLGGTPIIWYEPLSGSNEAWRRFRTERQPWPGRQVKSSVRRDGR